MDGRDSHEMYRYALHHMGKVGFGSALVGASVAVALIGLAISFVLKDVDESAWRWVLLIVLGVMGALVVLWFLWVLLRMVTGGSHYHH